MKVFAVRDEELNRKILAYLIYYEKEKRFYIELPENADSWETPLLLSSFAERGEWTINAYWSRLWVQQRIVPMDRQNLGQILRDNGLKEYDEFELLMLAEGRCAQDNYYLEMISEEEIMEKFSDRYEKKVEDVVPLDGKKVLVFFRNGMIKISDIGLLVKEKPEFQPILREDKIFSKAAVQAGGYGICWGDNLNIEDFRLYNSGEAIPLTKEVFRNFVSCGVVDTREAADLLDCSRQNVDDLVRRGKLHPIKSDARVRLFLKSDIIERLWK